MQELAAAGGMEISRRVGINGGGIDAEKCREWGKQEDETRVDKIREVLGPASDHLPYINLTGGLQLKTHIGYKHCGNFKFAIAVRWDPARP
jgi:hypothetical protein